jgi:tRNA threonylcarbamoyladenosine biosynthesis protein TsaE
MEYRLKELTKVAERLMGLVEVERAVIFALEGNLGAGKTALTKILAKKMGVNEEVVSPTFVLSIQYSIFGMQRKLEHIDCWRMESFEELLQVGLEKMVEQKAIIILEWADKFKAEVTKFKGRAKIVWVRIGFTDLEDEREISWEILK